MAELEAKKRHLPFLTSKAKMHGDYGISMSDDDFIEKGYDVWRSIGNIAVSSCTHQAVVEGDLTVKIPGNCEFVETVKVVDNVIANTDRLHTHNSAGFIPRHIQNLQDLSAKEVVAKSMHETFGITPNYILEGNNTVRFTSELMTGKTVVINYYSIETDEDGLPMLNDKEVDAICKNVALRYVTKQDWMGVVGAAARVERLTPVASMALVAAKIPEKLSGDLIDRVMDIRSSWDRKTYKGKFNLGL